MKAFEEFRKEFEKDFENLIKSTPYGMLIGGATGSVGPIGTIGHTGSHIRNASGLTGSVGYVGCVGATGSVGPIGITKQDYREIRLNEVLLDDRIDNILFGPKV